MRSKIRIRYSALQLCIPLLSLIHCSAPALAGESDEWQHETRLSDQELDGLRGGFMTADGLEISIGFEKAIYIDGVLHSTQTLNLGDLGRQDQLNAASLAYGSIIQSGLGNDVHANIMEAMAAHGGITIIQNSLDDQVIQQINQLDIVASNYRNFTAPGIGDMFEHMIIQSLR